VTRSLRLFSLALVLLAPVAARADDDKAETAYKALEKWAEAQPTPKTPEDQVKFSTEVEKRCKAYLKDHPKSAHDDAVRGSLANALVRLKKFDEALAIYESFLSSPNAKRAEEARFTLVRTLLAKRDVATARARLDAFMKEHPEDAELKKLDDYLKQLEAGKGLKVGAAPPPIKAATLAGGEVSLEDLKGKVVLVDFWATWCPPCKKELPGLKKLYAELHEKGFEIVGVDGVEKSVEALKKFIEKEQITWPQVVGDGKAIARSYGVEALPRTVLIGKDGHVAAIDLRGEDLAKAIRATLDGKPVEAPKKVEKPAPKEEKDPAPDEER
jgi:peroxiredoxin